MLVTVAEGTHLAWKILPGSSISEAERCFHSQSSADWSAIYAQFTVEHAVSYLNNHYDRGETHAQLVAITARKDLRCLVYADDRMGSHTLSPFEKAVMLRKYMNDNICDIPLREDESLMKSVGENLGIFVVLPDADSTLECAIPHCMMSPDNFSFTSHVQFNRDDLNPCRTRTAMRLLPEPSPVKLSKDQQSDPSLLGQECSEWNFGAYSSHCKWILQYTDKIAESCDGYPMSKGATRDRIDDVLPLLNEIVMTPVVRGREAEKSSDDAVIHRVTIKEASDIASHNSLSVKTLPRRPLDFSDSFGQVEGGTTPGAESKNTIIASDGKEYHVAPLCLPPPSEIATFLREMKLKRDQGYFRMTPPSKVSVPTPGRARYPELPKAWMRSSKLSPAKGKAGVRSLNKLSPESTICGKRAQIDENETLFGEDEYVLIDDEGNISEDSFAGTQHRVPTPTIDSAHPSFWSMLKNEIAGDNIEQYEDNDLNSNQNDADINSTLNIENFIGVPRQLEGFIWFGVMLCLEAFLYAISILLIRFLVAVYFICRSLFRKTERLYSTHIFDMCRGGLVIVGCSVLMMFHMSRVYHIIRTQSTIKLYSFTSMLEVFDRLLGSFGQDTMQYLHAATKKESTTGSRFGNICFAFLIAAAYVAIHSSLYFISIATLTVAVNTADKALMTVLIINNFAEIKAFAFKKFDKEALFVMSCGDITERFQIFLFFCLITALGMLHSDSTLISENLWMNSKLLAFIVGAEMLADWIKHAFIAKFNKIGPNIYGKYARILRADYVTYRKERIVLDYTHFIARRVGLGQVTYCTQS